MKESQYNKPRPAEPTTKEEWDLWERYREVSHCFVVDGKSGQEAHRIILERLRLDFINAGIDPIKIEQDIVAGQFGDMIKVNLLFARSVVGEELGEGEKEFLASHRNLI